MKRKSRLSSKNKNRLAGLGLVGGGFAGTALGHPEFALLVPVGGMIEFTNETYPVKKKK